MATGFSNVIEINLPGVGIKRFRSAKALKTWLESEQEFWTYVVPKVSFDIGGVDVKDITNHYRQMMGYCEDFLSSSDDGLRANRETELRSQASNIERQPPHRYIISHSHEGELIRKLADEYPQAVTVAVAKFRGSNVQPGNVPNLIDLLNRWEQVQSNSFFSAEKIDKQRVALEKLHSDWEQRFDAFEQIISKQQSRYSRWGKKLRKLSFQGLQEQRHAQLAFELEREEKISEHETRLVKMEKDFSLEMQLRASEKFWSSKRRLNRRRAQKAFKNLCWTGGIGGVALLLIYAVILGIGGIPKDINILYTLLFSVPTLLLVWILRIFANKYRSNEKMADDAEEREAMIFTFKALEHEERVGENERLVILNSLFRPHVSGAEESIPLPAWEAMVKPRSD